MGIAPMYNAFAERFLTAWIPGHKKEILYFIYLFSLIKIPYFFSFFNLSKISSILPA